MVCRTAGALTALALAANAFILPPSAASTDLSTSDFQGLAIDTKSQLAKIPCSACGGANDVLLNFTISEDGRKLRLHEATLYPVPVVWDAASMALTVHQVPASASLVDIKAGKVDMVPLKVSGQGITVNSEESVSKLGDKMVTMSYEVFSLEEQPMHLDKVDIQLLKSAQGELMILSVESLPAQPSFMDDDVPSPFPHGPPGPGEKHGHEKEKECKNLPAVLCKWKNMVEDKLNGVSGFKPHGSKYGKFGGCGGRKGGRPHKLPGHIRPHFDAEGKPQFGRPGVQDKPASDMEDRPNNHHGRPPKGMRPPHAHGPHAHGAHGPHHHRPHHHILHNFMVGFISILVPLACGMALGVTVSVIGMVVGRLIAFLWIKYRRGGQRGYASVAQTEEDDAAIEKGTAFVDEEETEALPVYEEAPAYDEKEQK
ncbi:hypothetical protein H2203_008189 [Taxawa tesnikishii (nom. ined.)]|nr:hypothetical protein H2203_008189 [Dothideales sp. JES 119]